MMVQFQKEFWLQFTVPLVRLDSVQLQRIRTRIPDNHNPFHYYVCVEDFSKYQRLLKLIQKDFSWTGRDHKDRLVLFTGRLETLKFLKAQLAADLKLKPEAIAVLDGGLPDVDQTRIVEEFGQENAKVRILLATEVAAEGLNLHYLSHKLIHFNIPWSLLIFPGR